ncbi:hypothetical protein HD806DRAFT_547231 [Xylariaceae sp. AK1471]|nr:hypothetical protein HD806DRAFT_547231 [Xylariaceae sp. AK1471]
MAYNKPSRKRIGRRKECSVYTCHTAPVLWRSLCVEHQEERAKGNKEVYRKRKESGKCPRCGFDREDPKFSYCVTCRSQGREKQKLWRKVKPDDDEIYYPEDTEKWKREREARRNKSRKCGVCTDPVNRREATLCCDNCHEKAVGLGVGIREEEQDGMQLDADQQEPENEDVLVALSLLELKKPRYNLRSSRK